ncbi:MAG: phosphate ABC transporter permease PstA [Chloroflexota bacterium]
MALIVAPVPERLRRARRWERRAVVDRSMRTLALACTILAVIPLVTILAFVTINGITALSIDLLTRSPKATGVGGGAVTAITGTIQMVGLATIIAVPVGLLAGVYVSEFAGRRTAGAVRFCADVLVGIPSILVGVFVFTFLVLPFKQYNAFAGAVALAVIMVPVIMRTTEEILKLVPGDLREASLAIGVRRWRTVISIAIRTGWPGILTGVMLAVARAAGETAPLIMTALGSRLLNIGDFSRPMDALPLFIYANARQPFPALNAQAWGAAFLLLLAVLIINILVRGRSLMGSRR